MTTANEAEGEILLELDFLALESKRIVDAMDFVDK